MIFEDVLEHIGVFGRMQKRIYLALHHRAFCSGMLTLVIVFYSGENDHWCKAPEVENINCTAWSLNEEQCNEAKKSVSIPLDGTGSRFQQCSRFDMTGFEPGSSDWETNATLTCDAGWLYDTSQFETTIVTDFNLVCERKSLRNLAQSVYFFGVLVSSTFVGGLSDRFGRTRMFMCLCISGAMISALTGLSNSYVMFAIIRALTGATFFTSGITGYTLKFVTPEWRNIAATLFQVPWALGIMFTTCLAYFIRRWQTLSFVVAIFPALILVFIPFMYESPRWLMSKGRYAEAKKVITKAAQINKKKLPDDFLDNLEMVEDKSEKQEQKLGMVDLFRNRYLRIKTLVLLFIWATTALVYYGLSLGAGSFNVDYYVSFLISGAIEIPAGIYVILTLDRFGRKPNLCGTLIVGGSACLLTVLIRNSIWKTAIATIGKFCITATFAIIYIFTLEQLPTLVRNVGLGLCSTSARVGSIAAPLIFILGDIWQPLPFVLFGILSIIAGVLALLLPETAGKNLPETAEEGEESGKKFTRLGNAQV